MLILCIDTATSTESIALVRIHDGQKSNGGFSITTLVEKSSERGGIHGPYLLDDIHLILDESDLTLAELDGYCVGLGPGSFTGLRISLATLKGLSLATDKPLYGVRTTQALCRGVGGDAAVAVIDARRGEIYIEGGSLTEPICCHPSKIWSFLDPSFPWRLVGDGALKYRDELTENTNATVVEGADLHAPRAALLAPYIRPNEVPKLSVLEPIYVRKSDAEINYPDGFPDAVNRVPRSH
ncbi:MAG: tRNA (adenosine(37)-N6)-threonylcarbamoyltransferase complex dimerization subunit type 1 TsaB [Myxococcota bacterium]|nr:tRNA (adenosine(37)-N6)-threonylcarbamoyltransferase complex dimerization subunit type 1 TsaB [Myxococcota bacterium]